MRCSSCLVALITLATTSAFAADPPAPDSPGDHWALSVGLSTNLNGENGDFQPALGRATLERRVGEATWIVFFADIAYESATGGAVASLEPGGSTVAVDTRYAAFNGSVGVRRVVGAPGPVTLSVLGFIGLGYSSDESASVAPVTDENAAATERDVTSTSIGAGFGLTADLALMQALDLRVGLTLARATWESSSSDAEDDPSRLALQMTLSPSLELRLAW